MRETERERQPDFFHDMNIFMMYDFVCEKMLYMTRKEMFESLGHVKD